MRGNCVLVILGNTKQKTKSETNMAQISVAEALAKLPPEIRAVLESQLKRSATGRAFQHVGHTQYYDRVTVEGKEQNRASGIDNPNSLKISYTRKIGRRNTGFGINRQRDGSLTLNAFSSPVDSISLTREGKLIVTPKDSFNDEEKKFIASWMKQKFVERPAPTEAPSTATVEGESTTTTESSTSEAPAQPSVSDGQIKVALVKAKVKATAENVSLIHDLMTDGGQTLAEAVASLAS
jgi:hypothetical protein